MRPDPTCKTIFAHLFMVEELERWRGRRFGAGDRLAPVLPIVLYTGESRWTAALLAGLEGLELETAEELYRAFHRRVNAPELGELRRVMSFRSAVRSGGR